MDVPEDEFPKRADRADISVGPLGSPPAVVIDVAVATVNRSKPQVPAQAAKQIEANKVNSYKTRFDMAGVKFVPFGMEHTGGFGPSAFAYLTELSHFAFPAAEVDTTAQWQRAEWFHTATARLVAALQRGNAFRTRRALIVLSQLGAVTLARPLPAVAAH